MKEWCPGLESNQRHHDFQSCALPTELPGHRVRAAGGAKRALYANSPAKSTGSAASPKAAKCPASRPLPARRRPVSGSSRAASGRGRGRRTAWSRTAGIRSPSADRIRGSGPCHAQKSEKTVVPSQSTSPDGRNPCHISGPDFKPFGGNAISWQPSPIDRFRAAGGQRRCCMSQRGGPRTWLHRPEWRNRPLCRSTRPSRYTYRPHSGSAA